MAQQFALVENLTGRYLPDLGTSGGYTRMELVFPSSELPPRLFRTHLGAVRALKYWKKGVHSSRLVNLGSDTCFTRRTVIVPKPDRLKLDIHPQLWKTDG